MKSKKDKGSQGPPKRVPVNMKLEPEMANRLMKLEYATMAEAIRYYLRLGFEYEDVRKRITTL